MDLGAETQYYVSLFYSEDPIMDLGAETHSQGLLVLIVSIVVFDDHVCTYSSGGRFSDGTRR